VPTMGDVGYADVEFMLWFAMLAPSGVPRPIVAKLNSALVSTLRRPDIEKAISAQGAEAAPTTPEEFAAFQKAEVQKWTKVVRGARITLE
jgi:tripartite-type tricarboxylate transporter receptor subunit TctC